jgi:hypothetical protein
MTHGDFSHFLVNRRLYGPGCGSLFDGVEHACGLPMCLVEKGDFETRVEVPSWFEQNYQT